MDERRLIERVRNGDPTAERELYEAHVDAIYRLSYRMTGDDDLAQDCTQETFIRAFDRVAQFRGEARFGTWLRSIATSVVYNALRKIKRFRQREVEFDDAAALADGRRSAEPDLQERLRQAIEALPDKYRMVFVMHDVEGYTHGEISKTLGVEVGTSKAQLSRARSRLRKSLSAFQGEWAS